MLAGEPKQIMEVMTVEHHETLQEGLRALLSSQPDIRMVCAAATADQGFSDYMRLAPDVIVIDLNLPGGLELIRRIRHSDPKARIIILVDYEWDDESRSAAEASGSEALAKDQIGRRLVSFIRETRQSR